MTLHLSATSPRHRASLALGAVAVAITCIALAPASALAKPVACGDVIMHNVKLQDDLLGCPGNGLVIGADGVRVNLGGHRIESANFNTGTGIDNSGGYDGVRISRGTISGFEVGIRLVDATRNKLIRLEAVFNGDGVVLSSSDENTVARSAVSGNGSSIHVGVGIVLRDGSDGNRILRDRVEANEAVGVQIIQSARTLISRSALNLHNSGGVDTFEAPDTVIRSSHFEGNHTVAISLSASGGSVVTNSELLPGNGLVVLSGRTQILMNVAEFISLRDAPDSEIVGNVAGPTPDDGIFVGAGSAGTLVEGNVSNGNLDDGIEVDAPDSLIRGNSADDNGDLGIEAVVGVIDGGGNTASGNGNPLQCLNVVCG